MRSWLPAILFALALAGCNCSPKECRALDACVFGDGGSGPGSCDAGRLCIPGTDGGGLCAALDFSSGGGNFLGTCDPCGTCTFSCGGFAGYSCPMNCRGSTDPFGGGPDSISQCTVESD